MDHPSGLTPPWLICVQTKHLNDFQLFQLLNIQCTGFCVEALSVFNYTHLCLKEAGLQICFVLWLFVLSKSYLLNNPARREQLNCVCFLRWACFVFAVWQCFMTDSKPLSIHLELKLDMLGKLPTSSITNQRKQTRLQPYSNINLMASLKG